MEVTRCLTCLALLLSVTSTSAEPQLFGLLRDKLPSVLPTRSTSTTAAPEISSTTPSTTTTTTSSPAGDSNPAANVQHLQALQALHDIQSIHALQNLQALQNIQNLQNLQTAVERAKRSGNILQLLGGASGSSSSSGSSSGGGATADAPYPASLGSAAPAYGAPAPAPAPAALGGGGGLLGGRGILSAILGSSSSNSATAGVAVDGKGPTYGNYIGMGAGLPMVYGQRSFDFQSFRQSLLGVLMQAVRAITGGVIALKGQLVRVKGQLLSAKGNIISASGEALSQFGRNIASNALRPKPPEPPAPPRPVYGPPPPVYGPPSYMGVLPIPRPVYGPPMYSPPSTISFAAMPARPMYGVPGLSSAPQHPAFNVYSTINTIGHDQPRFQASFPPPARAPSVPTYSSGTLNSYGPPLGTSFSGGTPLSSGTSFSGSSSSSGTPFSGGTPLSSGTSFSGSSSSSGTPFSSGTPLSSGATYSSSSSSSGTPFSGGTPLSSGTYSSSGSSSGAPSFSDASQPSFPAGSSISSDTYSSDSPSSHSQPSDSYGPPGEVNSLSYSQSDSDSSFGGPESSGQPSATYYKRNTNQGRDSDLSSLNTLQGAHAGLLLLKPVNNINSDKQQASPGDEKGQKNPQPNYADLIQSLTGSGYASPNFGAKIGERGDIQQVNPNERTLSLLFGSKKPKPLRPHPVTRALPPQVIAAASAKLAAQLDFAGRAPPRTAVAVSGPHGKFIMYHK